MTKKIHLEVLRIIAIFLVIFNHTGTVGFQAYTQTNNKILYVCYLFMAIICKIAVPIFFMISGALLIGKEESIIDLYKKRIFRIIVVILLFSLIQYVYLIRNDIFAFNILTFLRKIYNSPIITPYWYLYSYLSFLIILPFLRKMVKNMGQIDFIYLCIIWIVMSFALPIMGNIFDISINNYLKCQLLNTSIFFPIIGYFCENYFDKYNKRKILTYLFLFSLVCIFISGLFTWNEVKITGDAKTQKWLGSFIAIPAVFVYLLFKAILEKYIMNESVNKILCIIGSSTFGIYLLEERLRTMFLFKFISLQELYIGSMTSCLLGIVLLILIGTIIVSIMKSIPIFKQIL